MDVKRFAEKAKKTVIKFKYAAIVLVVGLILLMLPGKSTQSVETKVVQETVKQTFEIDALTQILQSIHGAGRVQVLLSIASGEETRYQTNSDSSTSGDGSSTKIETVIITDAQRSESGLISQVNPPTYLGAIVVCEGADSPSVKFAVTQAVAKITGLGTDSICVLKMK